MNQKEKSDRALIANTISNMVLLVACLVVFVMMFTVYEFSWMVGLTLAIIGISNAVYLLKNFRKFSNL